MNETKVLPCEDCGADVEMIVYGRSGDEHDLTNAVLVFGPMAEGDQTISGGTFDMPGWGWSCSCGAAGRGYRDEGAADAVVDAHLASENLGDGGV